MCRMTDLGADANYEDLRYFEWSADAARLFLDAVEDKQNVI